MKTGEPYIFQCHADVIEFAAALGDGGKNNYAFVCGPILLRHPDALIEQRILEKIKSLSLDSSIPMGLLNKIPVYPERRVQAAADLLLLIANYFSKMDFSSQHQLFEISRQQSLLAEELFLSKILALGGEKLNTTPDYPRGDTYKEKELIDLIKIGDRKKAQGHHGRDAGSGSFPQPPAPRNPQSACAGDCFRYRQGRQWRREPTWRRF